nr:MAG TPA: hypothetical protein [Caudoviricetes sp.]
MITPIAQAWLVNFANNVRDTCQTLPMLHYGGCLLSIEKKQGRVLTSRRIIKITKPNQYDTERN